MQYEELHQRFGTHIAKRVVVELTPLEFQDVSIDDLANYLEIRAERTHREYQSSLHQSMLGQHVNIQDIPDIGILNQRWREAEDLAYLVTVAESTTVKSHPSRSA